MTRPVLFWTADTSDCLDDALAYIREQGFTKEDVRLISKNGELIVEALRKPMSWRKKDG